jgi:hypothetical protein
MSHGRPSVLCVGVSETDTSLAVEDCVCFRLVFGDLLLHLGCELWFSFCTARQETMREGC